MVHNRRRFQEDSRWVLERRRQQRGGSEEIGDDRECNSDAEYVWRALAARQAQEKARIVAYARQLSRRTGDRCRIPGAPVSRSGSTTEVSFSLLDTVHHSQRGRRRSSHPEVFMPDLSAVASSPVHQSQ